MYTPVRNVNAAAQRKYHIARGTSFENTSTRALASDFFEVLALNEVEVVQQTDPRDTEQEVSPTCQVVQHKTHVVHACPLREFQ